MRAFVAVLLGETIRDALARLPRAPAARGPRARFIARHNLHVTLKFLGDVAEGRLAAVTDALRVASEGAAPFDLEVRGVGGFPSAARARVVFAGCSAGAALGALHRAVEDRLAPLGFARDDRPFVPHVTLARLPAPAPLPVAGGPDEPRFGVEHVSRIHLMASTLGATGPSYAVCAEFPLCGPEWRPGMTAGGR